MWIDPNDPEHFLVGDDGGVSEPSPAHGRRCLRRDEATV